MEKNYPKLLNEAKRMPALWAYIDHQASLNPNTLAAVKNAWNFNDFDYPDWVAAYWDYNICSRLNHIKGAGCTMAEKVG